MKHIYHEYKHAIKSGDILVFSDPGESVIIGRFLTKLIRTMTQSTYHHVGIAWAVGDRLFIIEAVPVAGIRIFPLKKKKNFYHISTNMEWDEMKEEDLLEHVGKPYSILTAIKSYFRRTDTTMGWQCVLLADNFLERQCIHLVHDSTPGDFVLKAMSKFDGIKLVERYTDEELKLQKDKRLTKTLWGTVVNLINKMRK